MQIPPMLNDRREEKGCIFSNILFFGKTTGETDKLFYRLIINCFLTDFSEKNYFLHGPIAVSTFVQL